MLYWPKFFYYLQEILKYKHNSVLVVSEIDEKLVTNEQFWVVTHRRQFSYIEFLSKSLNSEQVWTPETPFWVTDVSNIDLRRSLIQLPTLVIFVLEKQTSQYLSFIKFFNKSRIPLVLIKPLSGDARFLLTKIPFQFFLEIGLPYYKIKYFISYLLRFIKLKILQTCNSSNLVKTNSTFFNRASFSQLSERWGSVISGIQFTKKKSRKKDFFIAKNKYNLRLLRKS